MKTGRLIEEGMGIPRERHTEAEGGEAVRKRLPGIESSIRLPEPGETAIVGNAVVRAVPVGNREGAAGGTFYVLGPKN